MAGWTVGTGASAADMDDRLPAEPESEPRWLWSGSVAPVAVAIAATVVLWASAFPGIRAGLDGYAPAHLVLLRFLVASCAFVVLAAAIPMPHPATRDLAGIAVIGLVGYSGYQLALSYGEREVTAGVASLLVNTAGLFTALTAVLFLRERMRPVGWVGMTVSFGGATLIAVTGDRGGSFGLAALVVLAAAVLHSLHFTLQKPYLRRYDPVTLTAYSTWAGTVALLPFLPGLVSAVGDAPRGATLSVIYLGVFPAAVANVCWAFVLSRMPASRAASFLYVVPIVASLIGWAWLGESLSIVAGLGGALALGGVVIVNAHGRETSTAAPRPVTDGALDEGPLTLPSPRGEGSTRWRRTPGRGARS